MGVIHTCENAESPLKLSWVKAHIGVIGNERADELAKSCWTAEAEPVELEAPISFAKRHIRMNQRAEWNTSWMAATNGSWTRQIFPTIEHRRRAGPFRLDFVLTQFLSGHGKFGSYLNRFKIRRDPGCQCGEHQAGPAQPLYARSGELKLAPLW